MTPSAAPVMAPDNGSGSGRSAAILLNGFERLTGVEARFGLRLWDGSHAGRPGAPIAVLESPNALRRMMLRPDDLGLARAFVAGEIEVEGSVVDFLRAGALTANDAEWAQGRWQEVPARVRGLLGMFRWALRSGPMWRPLARPCAEVPRWRLRSGADAVRHHYDLGEEFFRLVLGPSMVYSSAYWPNPEQPMDLEAAQAAKLDLICRKLGVGRETELLDIGCGRGGLLMHAAQHYGAKAVGVTLSCDEAEYVRHRIELAGLDDRVSIRLGNAVDTIDGQFDAIASAEVTQHLDRRAHWRYSRMLYRLLRPGGRALSHEVSVSATGRKYRNSPFVQRYIFPGLNLHSLADSVEMFEHAGLEVLDVESLRNHCAPTYEAWLANLESNWDEAVTEVGVEKARAWRLFLATASVSCRLGWTGVNQIQLIKPAREEVR